MILFPKTYIKSVKNIDIDFLNKNNIKAIILDVDNTLIDYYKNMPEGTKEWCERLKNENIKFCIVSNSNKEQKVSNVAKTLNIPYIFFAKKPLKNGLKKAAKILKTDYENIAVVGDQIFTDVLGANRMKMYSILVEPILEKDLLITVLKRPIENFIIKKYLSTKEENK